MREGGLLLTVNFCSVVHFERPASTTDGMLTTCTEDGVTCMSCDRSTYHKLTECDVNTHCSIGESMCVYVSMFGHISHTNTPPETLHAKSHI